jgi:hypothetical protein
MHAWDLLSQHEIAEEMDLDICEWITYQVVVKEAAEHSQGICIQVRVHFPQNCQRND